MKKKTYSKTDLLSFVEIVNILRLQVMNNKPISISRLSDAELGVLYQDQSGEHGHMWWRRYCEISGVNLPNQKAKEDLISALKNIDILGMFVEKPELEEPYCSLVKDMYADTQRFFDEYQFYPDRIFYCFDHFRIPTSKDFTSLIKEHPPIIIGNTVSSFVEALESNLNIKIPAIIPCKDYFDIDEVVAKAKAYDARWAIVSAGTPAKIICNRLTKEQGITTLDLGNVVNDVLKGTYDYCYFNF